MHTPSPGCLGRTGTVAQSGVGMARTALHDMAQHTCVVRSLADDYTAHHTTTAVCYSVVAEEHSYHSGTQSSLSWGKADMAL